MGRLTALLGTVSLMLLASGGVRADAPASTLSDNMKQIAALITTVTKAAGDPAQNKDSAKISAAIAGVFKLVMDQVPDSIAKLSVSEQPAALADYKRLVQAEIDQAAALEKAFETDDNAKAVTILKQMGAIKKEGHTKYMGH